MKEKLKEIWKNKLLMRRVALFGCAAFIIVGALFVLGVKPTQAQILDDVIDGLLSVFTTILSWVIELLGYILSFMVDALKTVLDYGSKEFAINQQVINGWRIVRDVMNSFYIVVLIVIAIATLIRWSKIDFRQALPRLMISAILVNFSLTVTMFGVNFSNSVMHTFTNEISDAMPTLLVGLRAPAYTTFDNDSIQRLYGSNKEEAAAVEVNQRSVFLAALLSVLVLFGAIFGIAFYVLILIVRIVVLWMLMILAPLAFFLWGTPGRASSYWDEWFGEYFKQLVAGPLVVFFLYLVISFFVYGARTSYGFAFKSNLSSPIPSVISDPKYLFNYIIALVLMYVGLMLAQKVGGTGVGFAKKWAVDWAGKGTARFARGVASYADAWVYSKGGKGMFRFIPTYTGFSKAYEAIRKGTADRKAGFIELGKKGRTDLAAKQSQKKAYFRSLLTSLSAGDSELWKEVGLTGMASRLVSGTVPGRLARKVGSGLATVTGARALVKGVSGAYQYTKEGVANTYADARRYFGQKTGLYSYDGLVEEMDKYEARDNVAKVFSNDDALRTFAAGKTVSDIQNMKQRLDGYNTHLSNTSEFREIEDKLQNDPNLSVQERAELTTKRGEIEESISSYIQDNGADLLDLEQENQNYKLYTKIADLFTEDPSIGKTFFDEDLKNEGDINSIVGKLLTSQYKQAVASKRDKVRQDLAERATNAQNALQQIRTDFTEQVQDFIKKTYNEEDENSAEEIFSRLEASANSQDFVPFAGHMIQATRQGDAQIIFQKLNEKLGLTGADAIGIDHNGMKNFVKYANDTGGFTNQEAHELATKIQKIHYEDNRFPGSSHVAGKKGRYQFIGESAHNEAVLAAYNKKGVIELLKNAKKSFTSESGGRTKFHASAKEYFAQNAVTEQIKKAMLNTSVSARVPEKMWEYVYKNREALGVDPDAAERIRVAYNL